jgi:hypothetical protein
MTRRWLALLLLIGLFVPSAALAQGGNNPFGPLPQPPPETPEAPEPQPADPDAGDDDGLGGTAFWLIIGTTGAIFAAIAFFITRDMRRTVGTRRKPRKLRGTGRPAADAADALVGNGRHAPGSRKARAKAQQRAKTKAARKARRRSRSR